MNAPQELRARALGCLLETDPATKMAAIGAMCAAWNGGACALDAAADLVANGAIPGRPERPGLVPPRLVGRRSMVTVEGRAMLVHALAHIEFNAVKHRLEYWTPSPFWRSPCLSRSRTRTCASRPRNSPKAIRSLGR